ncbi:hypothetical protein IW261DRAFT_1414806 [Armillaria novae-zelandiae]|uniref:Uncharacterized protein n=1 Tax=Armillaria novae-zelandiae TaxID=153914 RepID=A0AA39PSP1_9AGAR|nr:hypothetical protein IW261DRAFT_1414806 [Armillaria novae-zelandiae]
MNHTAIIKKALGHSKFSVDTPKIAESYREEQLSKPRVNSLKSMAGIHKKDMYERYIKALHNWPMLLNRKPEYLLTCPQLGKFHDPDTNCGNLMVNIEVYNVSNMPWGHTTDHLLMEIQTELSEQANWSGHGAQTRLIGSTERLDGVKVAGNLAEYMQKPRLPCLESWTGILETGSKGIHGAMREAASWFFLVCWTVLILTYVWVIPLDRRFIFGTICNVPNMMMLTGINLRHPVRSFNLTIFADLMVSTSPKGDVSVVKTGTIGLAHSSDRLVITQIQPAGGALEIVIGDDVEGPAQTQNTGVCFEGNSCPNLRRTSDFVGGKGEVHLSTSSSP